MSLIFAVGKNHVIGRHGDLPWQHPWPEDRAHFERTTRGHAVIMGKRTWDETWNATGAPLPDRVNIVVTRTATLDGAVLARSLDEALTLAYARDDSPFVIGGAQLFTEALPRATRVYVTEIPESPSGDTFFAFDGSGFEILDEHTTPSGLRFVTWQRNGSEDR